MIDLVSRTEMLFDSSHVLYKDLNERDSAWQTISQEIGKSVVDCKTRWRSLRDLYHRKKKEQKMGKRARSAWEYMEQMRFLDSFTTQKRNVENSVHEEIEEDSPIDIKQEFDPDIPTTSTYAYVEEAPPQKRFKQDEHHVSYDNSGVLELLRELVNMARMRDDPTVTFFDSMARTVVKFPPQKIAEVKLKICQIVTEAECSVIADQL